MDTPPPWEEYSWLSIVILGWPLISAFFLVLTSRRYEVRASWIATVFMFAITVIAGLILYEVWFNPISDHINWFNLGNWTFSVGVYMDIPSALLLLIVCFISFLVHIFSIEYMKEDEGFMRYFAFLNLFTFSMIGIVITDNLLVIFMFWELVGVCSYLLIGHWYKRTSAARASKKAFMVNRIGDVGFLVGLAICWFQFNTFDIAELKLHFSSFELGSISPFLLTALGISLFLGAVGKSAQFPLQVWLPDAMEGPTPISALIHAATMVAAGVYLVFRVFFMFSSDALIFMALIGAITTFMGAVAALSQNDIKKVLAFSTISQLGYMVMALGIGAANAALFHLYTHAFFKAGLFLAAGSIIHSLHKAIHDEKYDVQNMRSMGGLRKKMPFTFLSYTIFSLSLIGLPLFSGFLSKDIILIETLQKALEGGGIYSFIATLAFAGVLLTAIYVTRQLLLIFFGEYRGVEIDSVGEQSLLIKSVLITLTIFSFGFIWSLNPFSPDTSWVMTKLSVTTESLPDNWAMLGSLLLIGVGMAYSYVRYKPTSQYIEIYLTLKGSRSAIVSLSFNNWFLDKIYNKLVVSPLMWLSTIISRMEKRIVDTFVNLSGISTVILANIIGWIDRAIIDGIVNGSVYTIGRVGVITKSISGTKAQSYILLAVIGILIIIFLAL